MLSTSFFVFAVIVFFFTVIKCRLLLNCKLILRILHIKSNTFYIRYVVILHSTILSAKRSVERPDCLSCHDKWLVFEKHNGQAGSAILHEINKYRFYASNINTSNILYYCCESSEPKRTEQTNTHEITNKHMLLKTFWKIDIWDLI